MGASAREFIRSVPLELPVDDVLEQARATGIKIKRHTVHAERHVMRKRSGVKATATKPKPRKISPERALLQSLPDGWTTDEGIAAAAKAGLTLTRKRANKLRYEITHNGKKGPAVASPVVAKTKRTRAAADDATSARDRKKLLFKQLILELGMDDTQEIWDEFAYVRDGAAARR